MEIGRLQRWESRENKRKVLWAREEGRKGREATTMAGEGYR